MADPEAHVWVEAELQDAGYVDEAAEVAEQFKLFKRKSNVLTVAAANMWETIHKRVKIAVAEDMADVLTSVLTARWASKAAGPSQVDQLQKLTQEVKLLREEHHRGNETLLRARRVQPIDPTVARTQARNSWLSKLQRRYYGEIGTLQCSVLSTLFPKTMRAQLEWAKGRGWGSPFPAVGEHIVPVHQHLVGQMNDVPVWSGENGLPLFRHLEQMYSWGKMAIQPTGRGNIETGIEFRLFVCSCIAEIPVEYKERHEGETLPKEKRVKIVEFADYLTFGDLHKATFYMRPAPSMRSMWLKAEMAFLQGQDGGVCASHYREMPDPTVYPDYGHFLAHCAKLGTLLSRSLEHVPPDEIEEPPPKRHRNEQEETRTSRTGRAAGSARMELRPKAKPAKAKLGV